MMEPTGKMSNIQRTKEKTNPAQIIEKIEEKCKDCTVLTPLTCTKCETWRIKREFRRLYKIMNNSNYAINLLNTLKNKRRIQILEMLSTQKFSLSRIQLELKVKGYDHSRGTIEKEYIASLMDAGLIERQGGKYYATIFGSEINKRVKNFEEIAQVFPARSKCYEETAISALMICPRTYEELKQFIPSKSIARVLQRLKLAGLIQKPKDKEYVYYFRTRRDPSKLELSPTEKKVYQNIASEGIPAKKLANKTGISLRRAYKYLRKLRRKKLVFTRKKPKTYALTGKGLRMAIGLNEIRKLVADFLVATAILVRDKTLLEKLMPDTKKRRRKKKETPPLTVLVRIN